MFITYWNDKERKENRNKLTDLKFNNNAKDIEIGNKDYIGKKRSDSTSKDATPSKLEKKMKLND